MDAAYTGKQIAERRKALNLTQKALAEQLHVTDKAVSKWERGVNFPDLGLMEALAAALETTPAHLLGLEDANQDEVVSSMAEISAEQLEHAQRDMGIAGWGCILTAVLLVLVYQWIPRQTVQAYQLLHCMIILLAIVGLYILFKYKQINVWQPTELFIFLGVFFSVLLFLLIQFMTGHDPHPLFGLVLICIASVCLQLLFCRMMRAYWAKTLPLILTGGFAIRQLWLGPAHLQYIVPGICCITVLGIYAMKTRIKMPRFTKKTAAAIGVGLIIALLLCFIFYPALVQSYVQARHEKLEAYALELLKTEKYSHYGLWSVYAYPEKGLVQFQTGGSGLAPGSTYEGFYYSIEDIHIPYQGFDMEQTTQGYTAYWAGDPETSDNWGKSTKIMDHWYWFEAHF